MTGSCKAEEGVRRRDALKQGRRNGEVAGGGVWECGSVGEWESAKGCGAVPQAD